MIQRLPSAWKVSLNHWHLQTGRHSSLVQSRLHATVDLSSVLKAPKRTLKRFLMGPSEAASMLGVGRRAGTDCVCTALPATCSEGVAALEETGGGTCMSHLLQGRTVHISTAPRDLPRNLFLEKDADS